jgi:hypothetical protein
MICLLGPRATQRFLDFLMSLGGHRWLLGCCRVLLLKDTSKSLPWSKTNIMFPRRVERFTGETFDLSILPDSKGVFLADFWGKGQLLFQEFAPNYSKMQGKSRLYQGNYQKMAANCQNTKNKPLLTRVWAQPNPLKQNVCRT